mmetsp:Transcript_71145/g.141375  ORF Transcript_71145/g.141375 Transcript_71145/m.141375 type:complete len:144 (+) Transcript_71145:67-498(+)
MHAERRLNKKKKTKHLFSLLGQLQASLIVGERIIIFMPLVFVPAIRIPSAEEVTTAFCNAHKVLPSVSRELLAPTNQVGALSLETDWTSTGTGLRVQLRIVVTVRAIETEDSFIALQLEWHCQRAGQRRKWVLGATAKPDSQT